MKSHYGAFHQDLHCICKKDHQIKENNILNYNLTPLDMLNDLSQVYCIKPVLEESISIQRVKSFPVRIHVLGALKKHLLERSLLRTRTVAAENKQLLGLYIIK